MMVISSLDVGELPQQKALRLKRNWTYADTVFLPLPPPPTPLYLSYLTLQEWILQHQTVWIVLCVVFGVSSGFLMVVAFPSYFGLDVDEKKLVEEIKKKEKKKQKKKN
jgi:hypothetical protein